MPVHGAPLHLEPRYIRIHEWVHETYEIIYEKIPMYEFIDILLSEFTKS